MRSAFRIIAAASVLLAARGEAQVATTAPAAPPPAKPTFQQLGLIVYPAKQQTPEQQALDEAACYTWAETQTGIHLSAGPVNTDSAAQAAAAQASAATQGAAVKGAARGAVVGVAIGAITGDAGEGAAVGAVAGAAGGRRARKQATAQAGAQGAQQAQAQNQQMVDQFKKAGAVCLEGRGYTAQ